MKKTCRRSHPINRKNTYRLPTGKFRCRVCKDLRRTVRKRRSKRRTK